MEIRDRALGIIIGTVVSAVIYTFVWPESEARTLPQKLAGTLGMLSKVMRIPRQQEVTALRTYLQIRIGLHAAFNACEEMCQRVALERQLDSEERALLIDVRKRLFVRAAIFFTPGMPPGTRRRRWITHYSRTEQLSLPTPGEIRCRSGNRTQPFSSNNA